MIQMGLKAKSIPFFQDIQIHKEFRKGVWGSGFGIQSTRGKSVESPPGRMIYGFIEG